MYKGNEEMHYIGIDVSKAKLDCLWLRDAEKNKIKTKVHENSTIGHERLIEWLDKNVASPREDVLVVMEATGVYHEHLAHTLHEAGFEVSVVNPARTKEFGKGLGIQHKTDKKDSYVLALYGCRMNPKRWRPEPPEIAELKVLIARIEALEGDLLREENRLEKTAYNGSSAIVIDSLNSMITHLKSEKARLEKEIDDHINRHPHLKRDRALLESIPGIGHVLSRLMLSVIHSRAFERASQVAAYLGLIPIQHESGAFRGRSRLSKTGPSKVRSKLYMAAIVASQHNDDVIKQKQRLLEKGKTKMQALGAAMRKLVHICFGVIKTQTKYCPQAAK